MSFNNFPRKITLICKQQSPFSENFRAVNSVVERTDLADHLEHFIRFESFLGFIASIRQSDVKRKTILCKAVLSCDAAEAASSGGGGGGESKQLPHQSKFVYCRTNLCYFRKENKIVGVMGYKKL